MSEVKDNGGPAFPARPSEHFTNGTIIEARLGMTLRDYFAAKAMQAWVTFNPVIEFHVAAIQAYRFADAMLEARKDKPHD